MFVNQTRILICLALACLTSLSAGCALFRRDPAVEAYEQARQEVENPSGAYGVRQVGHEEVVDGSDAPNNLSQRVKTMVGRGVNEDVARSSFANAQAKYDEAAKVSDAGQKASLYADAADQFAVAADRFPNSKVEHDALFMLGECHFFMDQYPDANRVYEQLLAKHPNSPLLDAVESRRLSIAQYWEQIYREKPRPFYSVNAFDKKRPRMDLYGSARRIYDKIRLDDPLGKYADDATFALANMHFRSEQYTLADQVYTDLITAFPGSPHSFDAHVLGLRSKLASYRGANYSSVPLTEADKLLKKILRHFPQEAEKESDYLGKASQEIKFRLAEREYETARYYHNLGEYRAARLHYQTLVDEYNGTPYSEQAQKTLSGISDRPDESKKRLAWLVEMFPTDEQQKPLIATSPGNPVR